MHDDLRPELYYNGGGSDFFRPCESCGLSKVVTPGDYCRACAAVWRLPVTDDEYFVVSLDTVEHAVESSGLAASYLKSKAKQANNRGQAYVIYFAKGQWEEITISERFHLPTVMQFLFKELRHT